MGLSNGESCRFAPAETGPRGAPSASVAAERLSSLFVLATQDGPVLFPPQGALVMHPSTNTSARSRSMIKS